MHTRSLDHWTHDHVFLSAQHARNERRTWLVVVVTSVMMVGEIVGGSLFGSMALLADGWHMATHAAAIGISALAYWFARNHSRDARFAFGTGKLGDLAAFSSAVILAIIAIQLVYESVVRLAHPVAIAYDQAIVIAVLGLCVNLLSAWLLHDDAGHSHAPHGDDHAAHDHADHHHHHHADNNLRSAYVHVMADAATSVLAIGGLVFAQLFDWVWIDPLVGLIGAAVIASWVIGLLRSSGSVLLDLVSDEPLAEGIRRRLETQGDRISDLHLWQVGPGHKAAVVSIVSDHPQPPAAYKSRLSDLIGLSHVTVEVEACDEPGVPHTH